MSYFIAFHCYFHCYFLAIGAGAEATLARALRVSERPVRALGLLLLRALAEVRSLLRAAWIT